MTYKIEVHYETGNSFGRTEEHKVLEHSYPKSGTIIWTDLDCAKASLRRIKEHNDWAIYELPSTLHDGKYSKYVEEVLGYDYYKNWHKFAKSRQKYWNDSKPRWHSEKEYPLLNVTLLGDDHKKISCNVFWIGHFETLYGAKIVSDPDDGWSFECR